VGDSTEAGLCAQQSDVQWLHVCTGFTDLCQTFTPHTALLASFAHPLSLLPKVPLAKDLYGLIGPNGGLGFAIGKCRCLGCATQHSPLPSEKATADQVPLALGRNGGLFDDADHGLPRGPSPHLRLRQRLRHSRHRLLHGLCDR